MKRVVRGWVIVVVAGCGDGHEFLTLGPGGADSTTIGSTGGTMAPTSDAGGSTSGAVTGSTAEAEASGPDEPDCDPGDVGCTCISGICRLGGMCVAGECAPYTGLCEGELNGVCDEGAGCSPGTDPFDCCATAMNGVCEEASGGGACAKGSDGWDCGYCLTPNNSVCDPQCPPGTDASDCCASHMDGVCEEASHGGDCPDGSDFYDCGDCPYANDGGCDEPHLCPPGSDKPDCCASVKDGVCEEEGFGGSCPEQSDYYDCGYCPLEPDGFCDEVGCPPGTDLDCCVNLQDGVCDEEGQGGTCPDGSDDYDCGVCPEWFLSNYECDEPVSCPPGSDPFDCCAAKHDGVCEEVGMGGACPEVSDFFDCEYCPFVEDGYCQEPAVCPPGSDFADCCAITKNGVCEEVGMGGECPAGSDAYDCGDCPSANDGVCDEPLTCPPGSDGDCP